MFNHSMIHAAIAMAIAAAATAGGCNVGGGRDGDDTVADFCYRADDCNYLEGHSVDECIDAFGQCYDQLTEGQQEDWVQLMQPCLDRNSCELFATCYSEVPGC